jgi:hypothetical protein
VDQDDYEKAVALIRANPNMQHFAGPRSEDVIAAAEKVLGFRLPEPYRQWVREFGAGNFGAAEVYGVIDTNFTGSSVPNGVWYTLSERREASLSRDLIVIGNDGTGNLLCLDCSKAAAPVVVVEPGGSTENPPQIAPGFGAYLLDAVTAELEQ